MQVLMTDKPKRTRRKRGTIAITYRLMPSVKNAISDSAFKHGRSENLQAEFLIKIGYLHTEGVNVNNLSDVEILAKFDELANQLEDGELEEGDE